MKRRPPVAVDKEIFDALLKRMLESKPLPLAKLREETGRKKRGKVVR